jgi:hypothetical protein
MALLKKGSRGSQVVELQELLNAQGFDTGIPDGIFGSGTERAVKDFQASKRLTADGVVGNMTWEALRNKPIKTYEFNLEVDITNYPLKDEEYYKEIVTKDTIYLHHTAGGARPDYVIDGWERDKTRGGNPLKVGTAFLIGRKTTGTKDFDGAIYCPFHPKYWSHHLGLNRHRYAPFNNARLNAKSIAIEICNYGYLEREDSGRFYFETASGKIYISDENICVLNKPWRGKKYFQKYTEKQIESLRLLILELVRKFNIPIEDKVYTQDYFDLKFDALNGLPGIWTHVNVREDKWDCFPQPELIDMLNTLYATLNEEKVISKNS